MSSFSVPVTKIDRIQEHHNADSLEIATFGGYNSVVRKGDFSPGEEVVYIPEAAVIPEPILEVMGLSGKLAGKEKNRVKPVRLRGVLSEGLVLKKAVAELLLGRLTWLGEDLKEELRIEKWEPPIPASMSGIARPRPSWMPMYTDIENLKKFPDVLQINEPVLITEKIHGTNFAVGMHREEDELVVSSRRHCLLEDAGNLYWQIARKYPFESWLRGTLLALNFESVVLYGEVYGSGVQDLQYGLTNGDRKVALFDVLGNGVYIDEEQWKQHLFPLPAPVVPVLYRGGYTDDIVRELTSGPSHYGTHMREGIVIRPTLERYHPEVGRVILKSISEEYLLRKGGTELQ